MYTIDTDVTNNPARSTAQLLVLGTFGDSRRTQMVWLAGGTRMWYRQTTWDGVWQAWQEVASNYPTFYKDYADLSSLASALGDICGLCRVVASGEITGRYNSPVGFGTIIKMSAYYNVFLCISYDGGNAWVSGNAGGLIPESELVWTEISQLGAYQGNISSSAQDTVTTNGFYNVTGTNSNSVLTDDGILIVTRSYKLKIGTTKVHFAVKVGEGEWSSLESAYLQPYNSLASLASALGDLGRLYGETYLESDLNNADDGLREFGVNTTNAPFSNRYGMVFTTSLDWGINRRSCRMQLCAGQEASTLYMRIMWNGTWVSWKEVALVS